MEALGYEDPVRHLLGSDLPWSRTLGGQELVVRISGGQLKADPALLSNKRVNPVIDPKRMTTKHLF